MLQSYVPCVEGRSRRASVGYFKCKLYLRLVHSVDSSEMHLTAFAIIHRVFTWSRTQFARQEFSDACLGSRTRYL